jgi:hypothetical protein
VPLKFLLNEYGGKRCYCKAQAKIRVVSDSKDELADKIKAAIEKQIPNMEIEFTHLSKCVSTN